MQFCFYDSPIGRLLLAGINGKLALLGFDGCQPQPSWELSTAPFKLALQQLHEYFAGKRREFTVPYALSGTNFQQQVLRQVAKIPYGQTASYSEVVQQISNPQAVRAVGMANATNCVPIIIPCHRVIGKNGSLTGFGGGLEAKLFLLQLEQGHNISYA